MKKKDYDEDGEEWIKTALWFESITGVTEAEFIKVKGDLIEESKNGDKELVIKHARTGKKISAGKFLMIPFGDLVCHVALKMEMPSKKNSAEKSVKVLEKGDKLLQKKDVGIKYIPVEFINRNGVDDNMSVDVGHLQSLPEFRNAVFQVASNFNAIEAVSELQPPEAPSFTENYYRDKTQGPSASISGGAAAIVRVHAAFYEKGTDPSEWSQSMNKQVELLKNLEDYFPVHNGYVLYENGIHLDTFKRFPVYLSKPYYKLLVSGLIGYHKDVQITSGYRRYPNGEAKVARRNDDEEAELPPDDSLLQKVYDANQVVDQVFTAAVNMQQGRSGPRNKSAPNAITKAKLILDLGYQGTYLAATANKREALVLTMVGGGAFGNELDWIFEAIIQAHRRWGLEGGSLKKVYVIAFIPETEIYLPLAEGLKSFGVNVQWRYPVKK